MLTTDHLSFSYSRGAAPVLTDVTLDFPEGQVCGLLGRNGAGKTTLLQLLAGALNPTSGIVALDGEMTSRRSPVTLEDIFMVPEQLSLPAMALSYFVRAYAGFYPLFSREDMMRHLDIFEMPSDPDLGALSQGERKKVFMAFALACNTKVLLLDEPTNGLDIPGKAHFRKFIASAMTDERIVVMSTHQAREVDRLLDHIIVIHDSRVVLSADVDEILQRYRFGVVDDPQDAEDALYSRPSLDGTEVIFPNPGAEPSTLNLETFFEYVTSNPDFVWNA